MSSVAALLATLVVLFVPGVLVAGLVRWPLASVTTLAGVPVFSVGVILLPAEFMTAIGSRFGVPAFVGRVVLLGTALVLRTRRAHIARLRVLCVTFTEETSAQPSISVGAAANERRGL